MMACIRRRHGKLNILINNAAISSMNHSLLTPGETMQRIMQINFGGTFLLCREAAKLMQHNGGGQIVNFSSVAVPLKIAGESIYAASKAAVECLTRVLAIELAPFGITSNALGPGPVDTELLRNVPQDKIEKVVARTALKRKSTFEDISNVVEFFIRPESRNITGQVIYIGGV
jgi:3-oxoacyl-[acyl-carrier protein] reductase